MEEQNQQTTIRSHTFYRKELFLKAILFILISGSAGAVSIVILHLRVVSVIILMIMILPLPLMGALIKRFTKQVEFQLGSGWFIATIIDKNGSKSDTKVNLDEVKSYNIQFPTEKFSTIKFIGKNNRQTEYSFFNNKKSEDDTSTEEIIERFQVFVKNYNSAATGNSIYFQPPFYATNAGLLCIIALSVLLVIGSYLAAVSTTKALPMSLFFGLILIIQLMLRRKRELEYYKIMRSL